MHRNQLPSEFRRRAIKYLVAKKLISGGDGISNISLFRLLAPFVGQTPTKEKHEKYKFYLAVLPRNEGRDFYLTNSWRRLRYKALKIHGAACQCCGNTASRGRPLHVDHIKPRSKYPELEFEISNLQVLCADCNMGKGAHDQTDWRRGRPLMVRDGGADESECATSRGPTQRGPGSNDPKDSWQGAASL